MAPRKAAPFSWLKRENENQYSWASTYLLTHTSVFDYLPDVSPSTLGEQTRRLPESHNGRELMRQYEKRMKAAWQQRIRRLKEGNKQRSCQIDKNAHQALKKMAKNANLPIGKTLSSIVLQAAGYKEKSHSFSPSTNDSVRVAAQKLFIQPDSRPPLYNHGTHAYFHSGKPDPDTKNNQPVNNPHMDTLITLIRDIKALLDMQHTDVMQIESSLRRMLQNARKTITE